MLFKYSESRNMTSATKSKYIAPSIGDINVLGWTISIIKLLIANIRIATTFISFNNLLKITDETFL